MIQIEYIAVYQSMLRPCQLTKKLRCCSYCRC